MSNIDHNLDQKTMKRRRGRPSSSPAAAKQGPEQPNGPAQAFDSEFYLQTIKRACPPFPSPRPEYLSPGQPQLPDQTPELDFYEIMGNYLDDNKEMIERKESVKSFVAGLLSTEKKIMMAMIERKEFVKSFVAALHSTDKKILMEKDTLQSMLNNYVMSEAQMRKEKEEFEAKIKKLETELESMMEKYEEEKLYRTKAVEDYEVEKEARSELSDELVKATQEIQALKDSEKALEDHITKLKQCYSSRWNEAEKYASPLLRLCHQYSIMDNLSPERNQPLMLGNSKTTSGNPKENVPGDANSSDDQAIAVGTQTPSKHEGINCGLTSVMSKQDDPSPVA